MYDRKRGFEPRNTSKFRSFLDLKPENKLELLEDFEESFLWLNFNWRKTFVISGAGPAGLCLADQVSRRGIQVCYVEPSPHSGWLSNYGSWVDEFEGHEARGLFRYDLPDGLRVYRRGKDEGSWGERSAGSVGEVKVDGGGCVEGAMVFHRAKVWEIKHEEFQSSVAYDDGLA
ncbi:hypothetical protein MLD38_022098 [Melastoma candidum]|uniref:Uncharacterized protein n=1 Tax=Melastoma candidum TaxID=119954 RepID=A0ACB9QRA1_9MYRT|nr:hypothetical protein MLD38_022098 [Melastoma candidum]